MQTRSLKTLLKIAGVGSFATAADELNMTLSAVSMQMKALEAELNTALFDRAFRPPKLTPLGLAVCEQAKNLVQAEAALIDVCNPDDALSGIYRVGFVATASVRLLPEFLVNARQNAPYARFDVETGLSEALEARLLSGQLEAAIVTASRAPDRRLNYRSLRRERLVYAVPKDHASLPPSALFNQLTFFHFLAHSGIGKHIADHIKPLTKSLSGTGRNTVFLDSVDAIMECVNQGIGFTLLPEPDVLRHDGGNVHTLEEEARPIFRELVMATVNKGGIDRQAQDIAALFDR